MRWPVPRGWLLSLVAAAALLAGGCASRSTPPQPQAFSASERIGHNQKVFDRAWELVDRKFYDETFGGADWLALRARYRPVAEQAADDEALYRTVNELLGHLKASHVAAISPRHVFEDRTHRRAAVGLRIRRIEGQWIVTEISPGSPAERAGIKPGWSVLARNGDAIGEKPRLQVGEGETVTYDFRDKEDRPQTRTMVAEFLSLPPRREVRRLEGGAVYLRFDEFTWSTRRWLNRQLKDHVAAPAVIVDLRENPGGNALALWAVLGDFFDRRVPAGTFVRRGGGAWQTKAFRWFPANYKGELAVLVDGGSASCSEIFADVIRHHGRGRLVGRKTAGAVVVSWFYRLPGGGRLQVAIRDFRGVDGRRLEGEGVEPNPSVPLKIADVRAGRDADVLEALRLLSLKSEPVVAAP